MKREQNQALLEDLIGELNDPYSLTRAEITAFDVNAVLPKDKVISCSEPIASQQKIQKLMERPL